MKQNLWDLCNFLWFFFKQKVLILHLVQPLIKQSYLKIDSINFWFRVWCFFCFHRLSHFHSKIFNAITLVLVQEDKTNMVVTISDKPVKCHFLVFPYWVFMCVIGVHLHFSLRIHNRYFGFLFKRFLKDFYDCKQQWFFTI